MDRATDFSLPPVGALCGLLLALAATGCTTLATALYIVRPEDVPARFGELKGKRVAVVCRPVVELQYSDSGVAQELSRQVGALLSEHVRKIQVIDDRKVAEWTDENGWSDYPEIGSALKADYVVGIDLERFNLHQGPTLYQGSAIAKLTVYDMNSDGRKVLDESVRALFPPNSAVPSSDKSESEFRRQFIEVLSRQVSRYFYAHESRADIASDSRAL